VDAGAYIGLSPVFFSLKYPDAKIVCVEPNEANYQLLLQNAQLPNITCVKGAIWNQSGHLDLKNSAKQNAHKVIESDSGSVRAYTIDEIMQLHNIPHIDILKMDVEGAELEIFSKGFEKWLPKQKLL
jgi:FkbM family methyltransferase